MSIRESSISSINYPKISINFENFQAKAIIDTAATISVLSHSFAEKHRLPICPTSCRVTSAADSQRLKIIGETKICFSINEINFQNFAFLIVKDLFTDVLIGHDLLKRLPLEITWRQSQF